MSHKGDTLIEALFSFNLYLTVIIIFIMCFSTLNRASLRLENTITKSYSSQYIYSGDEIKWIEKLLH